MEIDTTDGSAPWITYVAGAGFLGVPCIPLFTPEIHNQVIVAFLSLYLIIAGIIGALVLMRSRLSWSMASFLAALLITMFSLWWRDTEFYLGIFETLHILITLLLVCSLGGAFRLILLLFVSPQRSS